MIFRAKKNRRRVDVAKKTAELKAVASSAVPKILKALGAAVVLAAAGFGAWSLLDWAKQSPLFAVEAIRFRGAARASEAELAAAAGLQLGQNLVALDALAAERLISAQPWVKTARVNRRFPRTLEIELTEHRAAALVALGELYLLDEDGEPFKRVQASDALDLPIVTGIERDDYVARHDQTVRRLTDALALARRYADSPLGGAAPLSEVHLDGEGVSLITGDGQQVRLGEGGWDEKLSRLARVRKELQARALTASVVRLDNRARPAWVTVSLQPQQAPASPERGARTGK